MKNSLFRLIVFFVVAHLLFGCRDITPSGYSLVIPRVPEKWAALLGEPHWRIEWLNPGGQKQIIDISPGDSAYIELPTTWANPVTAWPFWPEFNLIPGHFKPAGGFFPVSVGDGNLRLSWERGPDTVFYWELAFINNQNASRLPANFDWERFRELFQTDVLNEAVRKDPWLIDWQSVAARTINSGFNRSSLTEQTAQSLEIPELSELSADTWYGASPFAEPLVFEEGEPLVFPVLPGINIWVCADGILRVNESTWVFARLRDR